MIVRVTEQDIEEATRDQAMNPIERALKRLTGATWLVFDSGLAREVRPPFRSGLIPKHVRPQVSSTDGAAKPCEFDLESL